MKNLLLLVLILPLYFHLEAQLTGCTFKPPAVTIHFGSGVVDDLNTSDSYNYERVLSACPTDGHYTYTPFTSDCFRGDWVTLQEDHTPGDASGNVMLVNAAPRSGTFLTTSVKALKPGTIYEFGVWMMNVCRPTDKCAFPLLPNIIIVMQDATGKAVMQFSTGELVRHNEAQWTQYKALFTTPASATPLTLIMADNAPGGCGNDFALDDITFRECIKTPPIAKTTPRAPLKTVKQPPVKTTQQPPVKTSTQPPVKIAALPPAKPNPKPPAVAQQKPPVQRITPKKITPVPVERKMQTSEVATPRPDSPSYAPPAIRQRPALPPPPTLLTSRTNLVIKQIETEQGEIRLDLYDNGEIDGDTVSVYHNNELLVSHARLSEKAISFRIAIDPEHPHHEVIMVAHNLGSIPPNTSLMVVKIGTKRYEVFISSTEQKNAKIIFDLKQ